MATRWIEAGDAGELGARGHAVYEVEGLFVAVYRVGADHYAVEDRCSHDGESLEGGEVEGREVICPRHGARFCLSTGAALTPPAYAPLATFPVRVDGGRVLIGLA